MRITLGQLREMVSAVGRGLAGGGSKFNIDKSTIDYGPNETVSFLLKGPWEKGSLYVPDLSIPYVEGAMGDPLTNTEADFVWEVDGSPADFEELGMTSNDLLEAMKDAGIVRSGWEPAKEDIEFVKYLDENEVPIKGANPTRPPDEDCYVVFTVQGPWPDGPLKVQAWASYLYSVAQGHDYGDPTPDHVLLWWADSMMPARWNEIDTSIVSIAKAAQAAGILDV